MWEKWSASEVDQSCLNLYGSMDSTRLLNPWDFLSKNTVQCCHFLLQGILPIQGSNPGLPYCRQTLTFWATKDDLPWMWRVGCEMWNGCESWSIKKAECQNTDAFELWYWRRLLSHLDLKEIQPVNPKGN